MYCHFPFLCSYHVPTDRWKSSAAMNTCRSAAGAAALNGLVYVIGTVYVCTYVREQSHKSFNINIKLCKYIHSNGDDRHEYIYIHIHVTIPWLSVKLHDTIDIL